MKRIFLFILMLFSVSSIYAQLSYGNGLTYERDRYGTFATTWGGWAHYWGSNNSYGIKMYIHGTDPRIATTTSQLVFYDSERYMFIDLHCRSLYQSSDETKKTNIRPLRNKQTTSYGARTTSHSLVNNMPISNLIGQLNPITYNWKDEEEYEKHRRRAIPTNGEEYGFLAQELEKVLPSAVAISGDGDRVVNYIALIPILVGSIQELTEKVAELEAEIVELKK